MHSFLINMTETKQGSHSHDTRISIFIFTKDGRIKTVENSLSLATISQFPI